MPFSIVRNDIARVSADVVVNAANERLLAGGGVCGAIFAAAGHDELQAACAKVAPCRTGHAVSTPAFGLGARWIVHAVGPRWVDGKHGEKDLLACAYRSALAEAARLGARSVAVPLISAGIFGFPPAAVLGIACDEIHAFLDDASSNDMQVTLVVFDRKAFALSLGEYDEVAALIDDEYVDERSIRDRAADLECSMAVFVNEAMPMAAPVMGAFDSSELADMLEHLDASFASTVLALIDARGLTDAQVYRRANLSRQLFSKLRKDNGYRPTKQTAVALAVALELSLDETEDLLERAGLAFSPSSKFDIIVTYFIEHGRYDIYELNAMLFAFDQPLLGSA
ncbi:macro domain-containing protein [Paratractidigestivibacter sp.]|uniref:macro domain-containing protein n=1 Tax=Paratractidigestivibacter sp. TaxID=2847316 RepID=UPI002ABDA660|nr:macro domain-containing protein [Paratractidigestivibacter sp.]